MADIRHRVGIAQVPRGVEGVNGHVENQRTRHLIAEAAKMRANIKIGVQNSQLANLFGVEGDGSGRQTHGRNAWTGQCRNAS